MVCYPDLPYRTRTLTPPAAYHVGCIWFTAQASPEIASGQNELPQSIPPQATYIHCFNSGQLQILINSKALQGINWRFYWVCIMAQLLFLPSVHSFSSSHIFFPKHYPINLFHTIPSPNLLKEADLRIICC